MRQKDKVKIDRIINKAQALGAGTRAVASSDIKIPEGQADAFESRAYIEESDIDADDEAEVSFRCTTHMIPLAKLTCIYL